MLNLVLENFIHDFQQKKKKKLKMKFEKMIHVCLAVLTS